MPTTHLSTLHINPLIWVQLLKRKEKNTLTIPSFDKDVKLLEFTYLANGNINEYEAAHSQSTNHYMSNKCTSSLVITWHFSKSFGLGIVHLLFSSHRESKNVVLLPSCLPLWPMWHFTKNDNWKRIGQWRQSAAKKQKSDRG